MRRAGFAQPRTKGHPHDNHGLARSGMVRAWMKLRGSIAPPGDSVVWGLPTGDQKGISNTVEMTRGGNSAYAALKDLPSLVNAAVEVATGQGFDHSCAPEQGRLLAVLSGAFPGRRIGETGTGCGVGLAWMIDAAGPTASYVSVEADATRASAATKLFSKQRSVRIIHGDWHELRDFGPFDLLVLDGGGKGKEPGDDPPLDPTDSWLSLGGMVVLDDFVPFGRPGSSVHDSCRRYWLGHPALRAIEVQLSPTLSTIIGTRIR